MISYNRILGYRGYQHMLHVDASGVHGYVKEASHKRPRTAPFHLYEVLRIDRSADRKKTGCLGQEGRRNGDQLVGT